MWKCTYSYPVSLGFEAGKGEVRETEGSRGWVGKRCTNMIDDLVGGAPVILEDVVVYGTACFGEFFGHGLFFCRGGWISSLFISGRERGVC